jgi:hypothetical protein
MSAKKLYFGMLALIGLLLVGLAAGAYGTNTLLSGKAMTLTNLRAKSQAQAQEQTSLLQAKKDVATYGSLEQIAEQIVPEDKDQAEAVREITNIAATNSITLSSITFPASTLGITPGATSTSTTTVVNNAATARSSELSQLTPVPSIPGVYALTIAVQSDTVHPVSYSSFINFLAALENNRRTAQVVSINIVPDTTNPNLLSFNLNLNEYIKP